MNKKQLLKCTCALALLALSACTTKVDSRGYVSENNIAEGIVVGTTTKEEVQAKLGSPSSQSTFGDETWYYIAGRKEAWGFTRPEMVKQDVTRIEFDSSGKVKTVQRFDETSSQQVELVKRTTPTEGHTLGFLEQVLGNIGRFNRPTDRSDTAAPGRKQGN